MYPQSQLTREDWVAFFNTLRLAQMTDADPLWRCVRAAYRSLNRTIHGTRAVPMARHQAQTNLYERLAPLRDSRTHLVDQGDFDAWHEVTCHALIDVYTDHGYKHFTIGQAQKWLNMSLKNIFALRDERLAAFGQRYPFCHVPIDRILMARLGMYEAPALTQPWSRLTNYAEYLEYQIWVRQHFRRVPLDVELLVYRGDVVWGDCISIDREGADD